MCNEVCDLVVVKNQFAMDESLYQLVKLFFRLCRVECAPLRNGIVGCADGSARIGYVGPVPTWIDDLVIMRIAGAVYTVFYLA